MGEQVSSFTIFADYHQIWVEDETSENDAPGDGWNDLTLGLRLLALPGLVNIATARNTTVPVTAVVRERAPEDDLTGWDHVAEASLETPSGHVIFSSPLGIPAARLIVPPGSYRVRVYFAGLGTLSADGLQGADHYRIVLWPDAYTEPRLLRAWLP